MKCNFKKRKNEISTESSLRKAAKRVAFFHAERANKRGASHVLCCVLTPKALLYVLAAGRKVSQGAICVLCVYAGRRTNDI